jgi:P4 family phage/plasmid primase-like protien
VTDRSITNTVPAIDDGASLLTAAMAYGKLGGFYLAPTRAGDIKNPGSLFGGRWQTKTVRDPADVFAVFGEEYPNAAGVALHAGRSGIIVIDVDTEDYLSLPQPLRRAIEETMPPVQTTRRGAEVRGHYLFRQPEGRMIGNGRGTLGDGKYDVRGKNGVIVLAPTPHPAPDGLYRWQRTGPIPALPAYLADLLPDSTDSMEAASDDAIEAFLTAHVSELAPHLAMAVISRFADLVGQSKARHDSALEVMCWAMREARAGLYPARGVTQQIRTMFIEAVGDDRGSAGREFAGILSWAVAQALGASEDRMEQIRDKALADPYAFDPADGADGPQDVNEPVDIPAEDATGFTDAVLGGRLAEAMAGKFYFTSALGWLKWDGARWATVADEVVLERVRRWVLSKHREAVRAFLARQAAGKIDAGARLTDDITVTGWAKAQSRARIVAITTTARGHAHLFRDAGLFDRDPDILNTPGGVVDLRTGEVLPHDPARMITKVTGAVYVPGAESLALKAALLAVPDDAVDWLQLRLGEAVTGHSGEQLVLLSGTGRNGKTLFMGSVFRTLGDYSAKVPNTLLLKNRQTGGATPERMTLRGVRLAYMEETPEDGYLDATVVKDLLDAEEIEGRHLYKDIVTWRPTHSLFLNTNHPPTMGDTGDGAWRRLSRLDFPYRFRRADEAMERPTDRQGDPALKAALGQTREGREALLAWMVAGAIRYYRAGSLERVGPEPASVTAAVGQWREDSDDLLRFIGQEMTFEPDGWVARSDMYEAFAGWMRSGGQKAPSAKTFGQRMNGHSILSRRVDVRQVSRTAPGLTRPDQFLINGLARPLTGARVWAYSGLSFKINESAPEQD